jgi:xylulokinase
MTTRLVLAWDLGTSGGKAGIVTSQGEVLASEFEPVPVALLPNGGAEQKPSDWWRALGTATERLLARSVVDPRQIAALGVTAQWSGTVAVDGRGEPLCDAIIWMDSRGARYVRELVGGSFAVAGYSPMKLLRWVRVSGGAPGLAGKDSLAHILYLKHARPEIFERAQCFLEPKDYLTARLTGRRAASSDSIALHWLTDNRDPQRIKYDPGLLAMAGIPRSKLPDLCSASDVLGKVLPEHAQRFGLGPDVVVAAGAPDVHSAAIGAGTTKDYAAHLYVGTSSWLSCHVPRKQTDIRHNMAALPAAIRGRYLLLNEQESAGACLTQLRDRVFYGDDEIGSRAPDDVFQRFDRVAAQAPPGSRKLMFLPWLYGERTPVEDHALRGGFVNYSLEHERRDMIRAVLEGVAYNSRWLLGAVEDFAGSRVDELRFIGGGADSALWSQIFADVLDRPMLRVDQPRLSNLRGAALIAFVALGELDFAEVPQRVPVVGRVEPRRQHRALYDELFAEFLALHAALVPSFRRLNGGDAAR